jgi:hypothetical protein
MFNTKDFSPDAVKFFRGLLKNMNASILDFSATMPAKYRIQNTRLVTNGKARNFHFSLNMRDVFILFLCYLPVTMPDPACVTAQLNHLGYAVEAQRYSKIYDIIIKFSEGLLLLVALNPTKEYILKAQGIFVEVFIEVQDINKKGMSFNWHTLLHFFKRMLKRGNMRNFWLFFFERLNKVAKATLTNGRNGAKQVLSKFIKTHIAFQTSSVVATNVPSLVTECQRHLTSKTNPVTGKPTSKSQQRKSAELAKKLVNRIEQRKAKNHECPDAEQALLMACAQSDSPDLFSPSETIDDYTAKSLIFWPVKTSMQVSILPCLDGGAIHRGLFCYLQKLYPGQHINITSLIKMKVCEVNGVTFEISGTADRTHTCYAYAFRPDDCGPNVVGGTPMLHVAKIRCILSVSATLTQNDSIASLSIGGVSPCTCHLSWCATAECPCPINNVHIANAGARVVSSSREMTIVVVDWLVPFHKQTYVAEHDKDLKHSSGKFMTSDSLYHEFDVEFFNDRDGRKVLKENREGNHFLDARRIIHGVVLKKVEKVEISYNTYNSAYYLVVQLPKFI